MKRSKRIMIKTVTMLLAVLLCLGSMIYAVPEDGMSGIVMTTHAATSGQCGDNLTWTLDSKGTLTISGTGPMWDWNRYYDIPWYSINQSINTVTIKSGVTSIGVNSFGGCYSLKTITIPNSVTSIGGDAFRDCTSLSRVTIPNSVTSIGDFAFADCTSLSNVTISDGVTVIADHTFHSCTSLSSVTIGAGVTSIGNWAFCHCDSLSSVTIPDSVTSIGDYAFDSCGMLKNVFYYGSIDQWNAISIIGKRNGDLTNAKLYCITAPTLEAHSVGYTSAKLTWSRAYGMDGYSIYRCDRAGSAYKYIADVSGDVYTYTNTGLSTGTTYYYKVEGYYMVDGKTYYTGMSNYSAARPIPATPVVTATRTSGTTATLTWAKIYGATGYSVYRSETKNGTYSFVAGISSGSTTTYKATGLSPSKTYYYKVRAYRAMGSDKMFSNYSYISSVPGAPVTPTVTAHSVGYTSIEVEWNAVANADGYEIYRCDVGGGTYKYLDTVDGSVTFYTDAGLSTGTTYYYKVRAFSYIGSETLYSTYSPCATARPLPATPVVSASYPGRTVVKLSWVKIYGATGYSVYRSTSKNGTYSYIGGISSGDTTTFVDSGLTSGKTYYYKVRAYRAMGSDKMFGNYSSIVTANVT